MKVVVYGLLLAASIANVLGGGSTIHSSFLWTLPESESSRLVSLSSLVEKEVSESHEKPSDFSTVLDSSFIEISSSSLLESISISSLEDTTTTISPERPLRVFGMRKPCYLTKPFNNDDAPVRASAIRAGLNEQGNPVYVGSILVNGVKRLGSIRVGADAGFYYLDGGAERVAKADANYYVPAAKCKCSFIKSDEAMKAPERLVSADSVDWIGVPANAPASVGRVSSQSRTLVFASHGKAARTKEFKLLACEPL